MPIPTMDSWKSQTSRVLSDRKNPLVLDIDRLLQEYHKPGKTDVQKQKILILMLYYATEWLVTKGEKENSWRRPHVKSLVDEIEKELRTPAMVQATQARIGGKPGKQLEEDPIEVLQPRDARQKFGLKSDATWGRQSAHSADGAVSTFGTKKNLTGYLSELQGKPVNDYVDQLQILAATGHNLKRNLEYLSKSERLAYQLELHSIDKLFYLANQFVPYQTSTGTDTSGKRILDLFAMDAMELIYVSPPKAFGAFHHSSFLSGKAVICAGEIAVDQGKITKISNCSGHYMPSTMDLLECVKVLARKYGVDIQNVAVEDLATKTNWKTALQFIQRQGKPPMIGKRS